ncbi:hypothetical protein PPUN110474_38740 [Pseudomonas putida]|nr:hypothetical protein PPUN110474_38740 [Pseudomonas putida]
MEDIGEAEVGIWPDAWPAFRLFEAMGTQWRMGPGGATGLDYTAIRETAKMIGLKRSELPDIFPDLRAMEHEALAVMAEASE